MSAAAPYLSDSSSTSGGRYHSVITCPPYMHKKDYIYILKCINIYIYGRDRFTTPRAGPRAQESRRDHDRDRAAITTVMPTLRTTWITVVIVA